MEKISRRAREKLAREAEMVAAAERLFYQHGFEHVTMDAIAKEAEFTKRTLYQYFTSQEDLYFAVVLKGFKKLGAMVKDAVQNGRNGFEKISLAGMAYYQFYKQFPETFRLMNYIGHVKSKVDPTPKRREFLEFDNTLFQSLAGVIEEGKADGSIRADLDPMKGACTMTFVTTGFFSMLSETGKTFTEHFGLDIEDFALFALNLLSDAYRPKN